MCDLCRSWCFLRLYFGSVFNSAGFACRYKSARMEDFDSQSGRRTRRPLVFSGQIEIRGRRAGISPVWQFRPGYDAVPCSPPKRDGHGRKAAG